MKDSGFAILVCIIVVSCTGIMKAIGAFIVFSICLIIAWMICRAVISTLNEVCCPEKGDKQQSRSERAKEEREKENVQGHVSGVGTI